MSEISPISYIKIGEVDHPIDAITLNGQTLPDESRYLPTISSTENGKMLNVDDGEWSLFSPSDIYDDINGLPVSGDISGNSDEGDSESGGCKYIRYLYLYNHCNRTLGWK